MRAAVRRCAWIAERLFLSRLHIRKLLLKIGNSSLQIPGDSPTLSTRVRFIVTLLLIDRRQLCGFRQLLR